MKELTNMCVVQRPLPFQNPSGFEITLRSVETILAFKDERQDFLHSHMRVGTTTLTRTRVNDF